MPSRSERHETDDDLVRFGRRVRELRHERGMRQEDLARVARVHPTYISDIEHGRRNPTLRLISAIARSLGVPPSDLLA